MKGLVRQLEQQARKRRLAERMAAKSHNECADAIRTASRQFCASPEWRALAASTIERYGMTCMRCGITPRKRADVNVDHIKPRKTHPHLSLDPDNLQVLCRWCNKRKGNKSEADYRPRPLGIPIPEKKVAKAG